VNKEGKFSMSKIMAGKYDLIERKDMDERFFFKTLSFDRDAMDVLKEEDLQNFRDCFLLKNI
jgi:hypothetical protein